MCYSYIFIPLILLMGDNSNSKRVQLKFELIILAIIGFSAYKAAVFFSMQNFIPRLSNFKIYFIYIRLFYKAQSIFLVKDLKNQTQLKRIVTQPTFPSLPSFLALGLKI